MQPAKFTGSPVFPELAAVPTGEIARPVCLMRAILATTLANVTDRYTQDVLTSDWKMPPMSRSQQIRTKRDLLVETGWHEAVVQVEKAGGMQVVHLEDHNGTVPAFLLEGIDNLRNVIHNFRSNPDRRMVILVNHLAPGVREQCIVDEAFTIPEAHEHVLVLEHFYIKIWQPMRPKRFGWSQWPVIPRGISWKHGILVALDWPHATQADFDRGWKKILGTVRSYANLQPKLLERIEKPIDFVTSEREFLRTRWG